MASPAKTAQALKKRAAAMAKRGIGIQTRCLQCGKTCVRAGRATTRQSRETFEGTKSKLYVLDHEAVLRTVEAFLEGPNGTVRMVKGEYAIDGRAFLARCDLTGLRLVVDYLWQDDGKKEELLSIGKSVESP